MSVLVFLEHSGDAPTTGALGVLTKAASLGAGDVAAVVVGAGALDTVAAAAGAHGATTVHVAADDRFDPPLPQPRVDVLAALVAEHGYDTVLFSNSVLAADVAAGLAARLDAGINWDLVDLVDEGGDLVGKQPALADSMLADVGWRSEQRIALFRAGSFEAAPTGGSATVQAVAVEPAPHSLGATVGTRTLRTDEGPSIEDAEVIVAGGLGLGSEEAFGLAEDLAGVLGGAVGATRAAVYKGWYPYSAQIGQTGKTVSPRLYLALGISGAVQHKVGMQNSKTIVAINKDANAPIFEFSDLAVVGDVHVIVPELIGLLRERAGS
jgi:electron transfer flavoprotein alpha subunit